MRKPGRSCGALPTTTTVSLSLLRSNSPIRKEERLAINASLGAMVARSYRLLALDLVGLSSDGFEKEHAHALHAHCCRTCPFFDCFCYGLGSSAGQHRCLK